MAFVLTLIGVALDRLVEKLSAWRDPAWFDLYFRLLRERLAGIALLNGTMGALVTVLIPVIALWLVYGLLAAVAAPLGLLAALALLVLSLGPRELNSEVEAYAAAVHQEQEADAEAIAARILGHTPPPQPAHRHQAVAEAVLVQANARLFGVLFWFAVLGPAGAVLFRVSALFRTVAVREYGAGSEVTDAAQRLYGVLAWAPARLLAASYALAGSFEEAMADWRGYYDACAERFFDINDDILLCAGRGAARLNNDEDAGLAATGVVLNLVWRALIVWLVVLGVLTLGGLLF